MSENKLVKTVLGSAVIIGIASGIGWLGRRTLKEKLTDDPSTSLANYGKWVGILSGSLYAKQYLEDINFLPK